MDYIGVMPDKYRRGISTLRGPHLDKEGEPFTPVTSIRCTLDEALNKHWESDAHCTCYWIAEDAGIPLLHKSVLPSIRAEDLEVTMSVLMFDWDTPGHAPLTKEYLEEFKAGLYAVETKHPPLSNWHTWYTSKHGARVVYELSKPVTVTDGERYMQSIMTMFKEAGLQLDEACKDWTRRFRLPHVIRDGVDTSSTTIMVSKKDVLDISLIRKSSKAGLTFHKSFQHKADHPTQEECHRRLVIKNPATGNSKQSVFMAKAKKLLKDSEWFDILFAADVDFCIDEGRNDILGAILGEIVPPLTQRASASAEDIFALMFDPLCQWEPLNGKVHPHDHCWNYLQDIYAREVEIFNRKKDEQADSASNAEALLDGMVEGMAEWDEHDDLRNEDEEVRYDYVKRRLFCSLQNYFYPLMPDGTYSSASLTKDQVIPYIESRALKDIIQTQKWTRDGEMAYVSSVNIQNAHSIIVQTGTYRPQLKSGGYITGGETQHPEIVLPSYRRHPFLTAQFDRYVDAWLKCFFREHYENCCRWIANSLAFEEGPICALSLQGKGSTGKKLLVEGLAECLERGYVAYADSVSNNSQGMMIGTPFYCVNENWPKNGQKAPADVFKQYTGGDAITINEKYKPTVQILNPLRVIFTANGHDLIFALTEGRSISPDDRDTIGERLYHVNVNNDARLYIESIGGREHTTREGARWIRGDANEPSDFVVAKHFLWLYEHRPIRNQKDRFCVMGNCGTNSLTSHRMMTRSNSVATIIKSIVGMVERPLAYKDHLKASASGDLLVTELGISIFAKNILDDRISDRDIADGMQNLVLNTEPVMHDHKYYYAVDCDTLLNFASERGIDAPVLRGLREKQLREKK